MKLRVRLRAGEDVRAVWLCSVLLVLGGGFFIERHFEPAIAGARSRSETLYRETAADVRLVSEAAYVRAQERRARLELSAIEQDATLSESTARLLPVLHARAAAFGTSVRAVAPAGAATGAGTSLAAQPFTMTVRGTFRGVLGFIADLSHHSTLIGVGDAELAPVSGASRTGAQPLDATIHATLYRLQHPTEEEPHAASAR